MNAEIIVKYLSGNCTEQEFESLFAWVEESEQNKQYFSELKNSWEVSDMQTKTIDEAELQLKFNDFKNKISPPNSNIETESKLIVPAFWKYAASIIITIGFTALISFLVWHKPKPEITYNQLEVPSGQQAQLTLADGTKIWLNSKSKLVYPGTFSGDVREVRLEGEGYFQVSHNPSKPFIVKTSHVNVKVLGTSFNVSSYSDDNEVKLALETGSVALTQPGKTNVTQVVPSELAVYSKANKTFTISKVETSLYTSWLNGQFKFRKMSFEEISKRLSRNFNMEFIFSKEKMRYIKYSGSFYNYESLDQILKIMQTNSPFKYKIKQNKVFIE